MARDVIFHRGAFSLPVVSVIYECAALSLQFFHLYLISDRQTVDRIVPSWRPCRPMQRSGAIRHHVIQSSPFVSIDSTKSNPLETHFLTCVVGRFQ